MIEIRIHPQSFDIDYEMKKIQESSSSGAMVSFLGSVRDIQSKKSLKNQKKIAKKRFQRNTNPTTQPNLLKPN